MFNQGSSNYLNSLFGLGEGLGSIYQLFGGNNPFSGSQQYLNQIPGQLQQYLGPYIGAGTQSTNQYINQGMGATNPFIQAGQGQIPGLQGIYNQLMNNPSQFINQIGQGYQQSPGYQNQVNQAITGANRAAAAGGMQGSPGEQMQVASAVNNLANQDYQQYLQNALGAFGQGLQGTQGLENQAAQLASQQYGLGGNLAGQQYTAGANAAGSMAQGLNQNTMNQLLMNYLSKAQKGTDISSGLGGLLGGLGALFGGGGFGNIFGDIGNFFKGL